MGTKNNPGKYDCYHNALPDEPMFILLARDPFAPTLVRHWAVLREIDINQGKQPESDRSMVGEALRCATNMAAWREKNDGKWREPWPQEEIDRPAIGGAKKASEAPAVESALQRIRDICAQTLIGKERAYTALSLIDGIARQAMLEEQKP